MRVAVLDLGTNTFNLLIVDILSDGTHKKLFNEKLAPKIGLGGINNKIISSDAFERGLQSLKIQKQIIDSFNPDKVFLFGTSAMRNAKNAPEFIDEVKEQLGLQIHIISGEQEAEYIFHGNKLAFDWGDSLGLILDIGGGSNEFIIADNKTIKWKQSFEIGMSRLLQMFTPSDPFRMQDIESIEQYVDSKLQPLYDACLKYSPAFLIGSSGAFDTFRDMIIARENLIDNGVAWYEISYPEFLETKKQIISLPQTELINVPGMDPMRVDMIGIAAVFVDFVMRRLSLHKIYQSHYSLKEGVIDRLIRNAL